MKRCRISQIIMTMQIKTTMRYHLKLVKMAIIKKTKIINTGNIWNKRNLCVLLVGISIVKATVEDREVPQKIKKRIIIWYSNSTSGFFFQRKQEIEKIYALCVHVVVFTRVKTGKQPKCPSWDKEIMVYRVDYLTIIIWTLQVHLLSCFFFWSKYYITTWSKIGWIQGCKMELAEAVKKYKLPVIREISTKNIM